MQTCISIGQQMALSILVNCLPLSLTCQAYSISAVAPIYFTGPFTSLTKAWNNKCWITKASSFEDCIVKFSKKLLSRFNVSRPHRHTPTIQNALSRFVCHDDRDAHIPKPKTPKSRPPKQKTRHRGSILSWRSCRIVNVA